MRSRLTLLSMALALGLAACGDDEDERDSSRQPATTAPAEQDTAAAPAPESEKPEVEVPDEPATRLQIDDIEEGDGPTAESGDLVRVNYVGVAQSSGEEFDSSYGREPFEFQLGAGMVIQGWDEGVEGMKVGGRRRLVIPAEQAYGAQGSPPAIGPNETLVFVIDLLEVDKEQ